ncbi:hypothetical protein HOU02_gp204 [Caulobacter phage CcrBL9]|uniref:Uncharacterized protein n=1 Tax=Caulobacter phage CcrBL9 TaxID=2283270 RepID=A0A385ECB2_9CAUD|nr:hypothetical protein HOU02_gp204 [Caulobacter phage CcrBL9]AXQ69521.1 hypothetical protein CcrBL9_gp497 [Caulobacter phage CcrBL9]
MFTSIRAADPQDPRPQLTDDATLCASVATTLPLYAALAKKRGSDLTDDQIGFALEVALKKARYSEGDWAWNAARLMEDAFGLPGDGKLLALVETTIARLKIEWESLTRAWVMRTGYRIPAALDEKVEAVVNGAPTVGKIVGVSRALGVAYMDNEAHTETYRIDGEDIIANYTQGRFAPETPILGSRYENAPALAAAAQGTMGKARKLPAAASDDAASRQQRIADAYKTGSFGADLDGPGAA